jgi:hypothetical protein
VDWVDCVKEWESLAVMERQAAATDMYQQVVAAQVAAQEMA